MKEQKVTYLEGLRGAAALAVVIAHYFQVFVPAMFEDRAEISHFAWDRIVPKTPLNVLYNGNFAVCLFFVLSGYVLSYRFFRTGDRGIVVAGMLKRYIRLAVPAFVSVLLAYAVMLSGWGYYAEVRSLTLATMADPYEAMPSFATLVLQTLYHTFFTYGMAYNPVLWTMTYELLGSLMIFAVMFVLGKSRLRFAAYLAGIWYFRDSYYLGFWLGMLLSDSYNSFQTEKFRIRSGAVLAVLTVCGIFLGSFPYVNPTGSFYSWLPLSSAGFPNGIAYRTAGALLLLLALLNSRTGQRVLGSKPMAYLGKLSFSFYLVHFAVLCSFSSFLFMRLSDNLGYGWNFLCTFLISLPLIFVLSHLMYRLVDRRIVRLLNRVWAEGRRKVYRSSEAPPVEKAQ